LVIMTKFCTLNFCGGLPPHMVYEVFKQGALFGILDVEFKQIRRYADSIAEEGWRESRAVILPYLADIGSPAKSPDRTSANRNVSFFFAGRLHRRDHGLRMRLADLIDLLPQSLVCHIDTEKNGAHKGKLLESFELHFTSADACFCPLGDTATSVHIFEALSVGCIPIVVNDPDRVQLPFTSDIDWSSIAVYFNAKVMSSEEGIHQLAGRLMELRMNATDWEKRRQQGIRAFHKHLDYLNNPRGVADAMLREAFRKLRGHSRLSGLWTPVPHGRDQEFHFKAPARPNAPSKVVLFIAADHSGAQQVQSELFDYSSAIFYDEPEMAIGSSIGSVSQLFNFTLAILRCDPNVHGQLMAHNEFRRRFVEHIGQETLARECVDCIKSWPELATFSARLCERRPIRVLKMPALSGVADYLLPEKFYHYDEDTSGNSFLGVLQQHFSSRVPLHIIQLVTHPWDVISRWVPNDMWSQVLAADKFCSAILSIHFLCSAAARSDTFYTYARFQDFLKDDGETKRLRGLLNLYEVAPKRKHLDSITCHKSTPAGAAASPNCIELARRFQLESCPYLGREDTSENILGI